MLENIRIGPLRALPPTDLKNLGHVNVVCGKNNSGKSTVLLALASPNMTDVGNVVGDDVIDQLYQSLRSAHPIREFAENNRLVVAIRRILNDINRERFSPVMRRSKIGEFVSEVADRFKLDADLRQFGFNFAALSQIFEAFFGETPPATLIPPKRQLETTTGIGLNNQVTTTGSGLLAYLFFAGNQRKESADRKLCEEIRRAFEQITDGFIFRIEPSRENVLTLVVRAPRSAQWVNAPDAGLGLQDLLVILYHAMRAGPELVLIEEPENHLHPDMQRRLLHLLRSRNEKQFFLSTHSSIFVSGTLVDRIFYTELGDAISVSEVTSRAHVLENLGYSITDNLVSDLVILVEGPSDRPIVDGFLDKLDILSKYDIRIWPLGGDIMSQLDLSVFAQSYKVLALIDRDDKSGAIREKFVENCKAAGIEVFRLNRYAIENYFSLRALHEVFGDKIHASVTELDPNKKLQDQIGKDVKKWNRELTHAMQLREIDGTDLRAFFDLVRKNCEAAKTL